MRSERIEFSGSLHAMLSGRLDLPDREPRAFALFAHCFTCSKDVVAASRISHALTDYGIGVLRFDFTGLGGSDGDFANTNFSSNIADLVLAADYLRAHDQAPSLLVGHSLGGAAVLAATNRIAEVRAVATIGAPAGTDHVLHLLGESGRLIDDAGEAEVSLASRTFTIRRQFLDDIRDQPQEERIRDLGAALLVLHSPEDDTVGIDNARRIFDAARHPKSFIALDGADHMLTRPADARFAATLLADWAARYVDLSPTPEAAASPPPEGAVVVAENGRGPYGQSIAVGRHTLYADEPEGVGHDTGPTPYDLVLAGLGACTSMTIRMYADRKGWPLDHVSVSLRHSRIHATDCAVCDTASGSIDHIDRVIRLTGTLDASQRARLLEMAEKCPVRQTLHSEIHVTSSLDESAVLSAGD